MTDSSIAPSGATAGPVGWTDLVTVAVLGTDRRDPPPAPPGPLAELALEAPPADPAAALVQMVAAATALDRAAAPVAPALPLLVPAEDDPRPLCSPRAARLLRRAITDWPVLEREWFDLADSAQRRLSPDLVPLLLWRHRARPDMRARVCVAAGPVADWLVDQVPSLAPARSRASSPPAVAMPAELARVAQGSAAEIAAVVVDGIRRQRYTTASGSVVVHLLAHVPADHLPHLARALDDLDPDLPGRGLVLGLLDLVDLRRAIVAEFTCEPAPEPAPEPEPEPSGDPAAVPQEDP